MIRDIIGNIMDSQNNPIVGATIQLGTATTQTKDFGYYEIKADGDVLKISATGYKPKEYDLTKIGGVGNVDLQLEKDEKTTNTPIGSGNLMIPQSTMVSQGKLMLIGGGAGAIAYFGSGMITKDMKYRVGIALGVAFITYWFASKVAK